MIVGFDAKRFFHNKTGLGNYSRDLVRILAMYYPENTYLLYNPNPAKSSPIFLDGEIIQEKIPIKKKDKIFSSFWRLFKIVPEIKADKVTIYHGLSGEIPIGLHKNGPKIIVTIHDLIFIHYPELYSFFDRKIHYLKFKYAAKNSDLIIAISEQTKKDIIYFFKIKPEKIKVIYQGCAPIFKEEIELDFIEMVKNKYRLPSKFILNVGTIEKRKNILSVIKSIRNIDIHLVVIGKKTIYFKEIKEYISENGIEAKIIFLENVDIKELAVIYRLAKIFIYPSIFEGFGIPIIEALYSRTPVITTEGGCFKEAGGENSIYIDTRNINEIENCIKNLLNEPEKQEMMKIAGFKFVQKFNDNQIAKDIILCYDDIINCSQKF
jgi:glycosyltransferase involved in cell wall biosynthesis